MPQIIGGIVAAGIIAIIVIVTITVLARYHKKRIVQRYACADGVFYIRGTEKKFRIYKGNRFVFNVVNGQIVSFIDKATGNQVVEYRGMSNGDS